MRRTIAILAVLLLSVTALAASGATDDGAYKGVTNRAMRPVFVEPEDGVDYALFGNAASLATAEKGTLKIQVPYLSASSYNVSNALKDKGVAEALSGITRFQWNKQNWVTYMLGLVMASGNNYGEVFAADLGLGAQIGKLAFGFNVNAAVHSMPGLDAEGNPGNGSSPISNGYVPEVDYALTVAYGMRVFDSERLTIDAGAAVRFAEKLYLLQLNTTEISHLIDGSKDFNSLAARGGFAFPVDLGVTFGFLGGRLNFDVTATNLNGYYYMANYENITKAATFSGGTDRYTLYTPFSLNAGVTYTPGFKYVNPTVYAKFADIVSFYKDDDATPPEFIDLGVKLSIMDIVTLRASYRYGYPEFAVGAQFHGNMIELSYGFEEAGAKYGEKPIDKLTFRMKLGYDN
jgi:hypothetical protein